MVDDIISIHKCSIHSVKSNAVINAFIEGKKLKLSKRKCHRIHISKQTPNVNHAAPTLKVYDVEIENSEKERNLVAKSEQQLKIDTIKDMQ